MSALLQPFTRDSDSGGTQDPIPPDMLSKAAEAFARCGGVVSLTEFSGLSVREVASIIAARRQYFIELFTHIGLACQGPMGIAKLEALMGDSSILEDIVARAGLAAANE